MVKASVKVLTCSSFTGGRRDPCFEERFSESLCESSSYATSPALSAKDEIRAELLCTHLPGIIVLLSSPDWEPNLALIMNIYTLRHVLITCVLFTICYQVLANDAAQEEHVRNFFNKNGGSDSSHTNNWAVLVCSSRYWFNYRVRADRPSSYNNSPIQHMANALGMCVTSAQPSHYTRRSFN